MLPRVNSESCKKKTLYVFLISELIQLIQLKLLFFNLRNSHLTPSKPRRHLQLYVPSKVGQHTPKLAQGFGSHTLP